MPRNRAIATKVSVENQLRPRWLAKWCADGVDLPLELCLGQGYEEIRIAEIAVVFRNFVFEHEVIAEGVVSKLGQQPVVLMSVALPVGQDERRIEIAFDGLEAVLDVGALGGEIPIAEPKHLDLLSQKHAQERRPRCSAPRSRAGSIAAENDPSHDEIGYLGSDAQNGSAAADLDVVGVGTQAKQLQRPSPRPAEERGEASRRSLK